MGPGLVSRGVRRRSWYGVLAAVTVAGVSVLMPAVSRAAVVNGPPPAEQGGVGFSSWAVSYQTSANALGMALSDGTNPSLGDTVMAGTSPAVVNAFGLGYVTVFQNTGGHLAWDGSLGPGRNAAMAAGTSPAIAQNGSSGGYEVAYQGTNGDLWTVAADAAGGVSAPADSGLGMAAHTSPSIAMVASGYEIAFETNTDLLGLDGTEVASVTSSPMAAGVSPSITTIASNGGYEVAYQASSASVATYGDAGTGGLGLGMAAGTSPAVTGTANGGYEIAFQANTSTLWTTGSLGGGNSGLAMAAGTSPGITASASASSPGYEIAFQASSHTLSETGNGGTVTTNLAMTGSPAIAGVLLSQPASTTSLAPPVVPSLQVGYQAGGTLEYVSTVTGAGTTSQPIATGTSPVQVVLANGETPFFWHGANGDLWRTTPNGPSDLGIAMAAGTSPSVVAFPDDTWEAVVNGADGTLHSATPSGDSMGTGISMAPGTSPSIAAMPEGSAMSKKPVPDGSDFAWQGSNGDLWLEYEGDTGLKMAPGTSPSVTDDEGHPYVTVQGSDGDLWEWYGSPLDLLSAMAPGTSPSTLMTASDSMPWTVYQGGNGDLFLRGQELQLPFFNIPSGDTGLPMMAGSSPSLTEQVVPLTPGVNPGNVATTAPAAYVAYASNTGAVSLFGYNPSSRTEAGDLEESLGQTVAAGTSPDIMSTNDLPVAPLPVGSSAKAPGVTAPMAGTASAKTPATPVPQQTGKAPVVARTSTCPAAGTHLKQSAGQGTKMIECLSSVKPVSPASVPGAVLKEQSQAQAKAAARAGVSPTVSPIAEACPSTGNFAYVSRTEVCLSDYEFSYVFWQTVNGERGPTIGYDNFLLSQDVGLLTNTNSVTEFDTVTFLSQTPASGEPPTTVEMTWEPGCTAPCGVTSAPGTFNISVNQTQVVKGTFSVPTTPAAPTTTALSYQMPILAAGYTIGSELEFSNPLPIRCDQSAPGTQGPGCVFPGYTPTLLLPASVFGAGAVNVAAGEQQLTGNPGQANPLHRGDPDNNKANMAAICDGSFVRDPSLVPDDSCDEYPFASTQESGGQLKLTGPQCIEGIPYVDPSGQFVWNQRNNIFTGQCERGHVPGPQNSFVGGALGGFYQANRMIIGDPFYVQVL